ncbi:MAG: hypothetical protein M1376_00075 [Planctomycetes bacterium]|nr:hypothetical protein [Planctomycetota bacterium]
MTRRRGFTWIELLVVIYTLQGHRSFNTRGPWTRAGGVVDADWPDWIRPFKDY